MRRTTTTASSATTSRSAPARCSPTGASQGTGFQPCYGAVGTGGGTGTCNANLVNEGHDEGMEFANGNYALLASALQYANDTTAPVVDTASTARRHRRPRTR